MMPSREFWLGRGQIQPVDIANPTSGAPGGYWWRDILRCFVIVTASWSIYRGLQMMYDRMKINHTDMPEDSDICRAEDKKDS